MVGLVGARFELGLDGERDLQGERGDGVEQQLADRGVDAVAGDRLAARPAALDRLADALVVGDQRAAALVVADGHPPAAAAADEQALQQRRPFAGGPGGPLGAVGVRVAGEQALVALELVPADVAEVGVRDQRRPLLARQLLHARLPVGRLAGAAAAVDERARVARVVPVAERHPDKLALALAAADAGGEAQPLAVEGLHDGARRAGALEGGEQVAERLLDALVGVERDLAGGVGDEPDRQRQRQLAAAGLGEDAPAQARAQEVQLRLRHLPLEPEQQPVVELARVVEAVLVQDQRLGERADLEQPVPIGVVAGEAGDLEPEHDPGPADPDLPDEALEALAVGGGGARAALVLVDHDDLLGRPAERDRALAERVLALP